MYANPRANLGLGSSSAVGGGFETPVRISLNYQQLIYMYRGSWVVRAIVDTRVEDMFKAFPKLRCQLDPKQRGKFEKMVQDTQTLHKFIEGAKWGNLFGGALGLIILAGDENKDLSQPLRIEDVDLDSYRGLLIFDRMSGMSPSGELVTDISDPAAYGLPKYYEIFTEGSQTFRVHHSRCLRFLGRDLPLLERQIDNSFGMSDCEAILSTLNRYEYSMEASADLVGRANVMVLKQPMLAQILSGTNMTAQQVQDYLQRQQAVSQSIGTNGMLSLGEGEELFQNTYTFGGLSDLLTLHMTAVSGAAGYPRTKLFGETATGLGQTGEGEITQYEDASDAMRKRKYSPLLNRLFPVMCMSVFGEVPADLDFEFAPIHTATAKEQAEMAKNQSDLITGYFNAGIIGRKTSLQMIQDGTDTTGIGTQITDAMIAEADDALQVPEAIAEEEARAGTEDFSEQSAGGTTEAAAKDSIFSGILKRLRG